MMMRAVEKLLEGQGEEEALRELELTGDMEGLRESDGDDIRIFAWDPFKVRDGDDAHGGAGREAAGRAAEPAGQEGEA